MRAQITLVALPLMTVSAAPPSEVVRFQGVARFWRYAAERSAFFPFGSDRRPSSRNREASRLRAAKSLR